MFNHMLQVLYGNLKIHKKMDYLILPLKILYIIYTAPFLLFVFLMYIRTLGAFGNPSKEKFGVMKKIFLHLAGISISFGLWIIILGILEETLGIKVRLH